MTQTPIETVAAFCKAWGPSNTDLKQAFRDYFLPDTIWENVGLVTTKGPDEALALLAQFEKSAGIAAFKVDMVNIAAAGDKVMTERVDYKIDAQGKVSQHGIRAMGIFEVKDGRIAAWRDYFDTAPFKKGAS